MMVSFFRVALLASLVVLCLLPAGWAASSDNSWIVDTALPSLLRFNLKGEVVSSDLSDYIKFTCHGVGKDKTCSIDDSNTDLTDMNKLLEPSSSDSIQSYGTGVALYFFIAVLGAILVILGTLLYIIFFCGFDFFCLTTCFKRKAVFKKNARQVCALVFLAAFFAFLVAVIILCYTRGITTAFDGVSETSDAPAGFATVAYRMSTALMPTYVAILGSVVVPTMRVLNSTINEVVNYEDVVNDLEVLNATVGRLPNIDVILDVLNNIDQGITDLNADITGVLSDYTTYQTATQEVSDSTDLLIADLRGINASLEAVSENIVFGLGVTQDLSGMYVSFFGNAGPGSYSPSDTDGLIDSVQHDIMLLRRNDTPGQGIPTAPTCEAAATNISRLLVAPGAPLTLDGEPEQILALSEQLHGIYDSLRMLPNFTNTAYNLIALNDTVRDALAEDGVIDQMTTFLNNINTDLANVPNTTLIAAHARTLFAQVNAINTASVYSHVLSMNATVATLPAQVDILITEADKISGLILSIIPPLYDLLVVQAEGFNRTIMATPVNTRKIFNNINKTIHEAADTADEFLPKLRDLQDNFSDDLDVSSYLSQISDFQGEIDTNLASIDDDAILAAIESASVSGVFNATAALISLREVQRVLKNVAIGQDAIDKLNQLEASRYALEQALERVAARANDVSSAGVTITKNGDYWTLAQGVCSAGSAVYCDTDADCDGGGTCGNIGKYRCTTSASTATTVDCMVDSTCIAVDAATYCLNDNVRVTYLATALDELGTNPNKVPDLSDIDAELEDVRAGAASFDPAAVQTDLAAVQDDIDSANTVEYEESLQTLKDSITDTSTEFDDIIDQVETSQDLMNEVDISDYTEQLKDVQKRIDQYGDKIGEYMTLVKDMEKYIFSDQGLNKRFTALETDALQTSMEERGFGQTLLYTGQVLEDTMDDVLQILKNNSFGTKGVEITKRLREPARYMDRLTGNEHVGFVDIYTVGSLYYLLQMSNASADYQVLAHDPMQKLVLTDINGDRYPDNKYCVTKRCFENQQDDLEDNYGTYLPLILIPLAVVCLIAIANVLCLFNPTDNAGGKLFCSRFLMCFIIVIVPWYLVFSGLIFAFTIAASDGCSSGPKIAANYVSAMGDDLCLKLDGNGTLTECRFKGNGVDIVMDLQAMTDAIIGTGQCGSEVDPFYAPLHSLAEQLHNITDDKVGDVVNGKSLKRFRQPLKTIILDSSSSGATVMEEFIETIGYEVLTCDNLSSMLQSFKEPVCYTSVGSWAWLVACIYLASWCMCCMGLPAACALKNHYRLTMLEEIEEAITNKKSASKKEFLSQLAMARRGRGLLARKFQHKKALYVDHDVEMTAMDTSGGYNDGSGGGGGGYVYATVSQDEDEGRAPVPVNGSTDPAEAKTKGFFAKYPKVSSKQNVLGSSVHSMSAHSVSDGGSATNSPARGSGGNRGSGGYAAVAAADEAKAGDEGSDASSDYGELQETSVLQVNTYRSEV